MLPVATAAVRAVNHPGTELRPAPRMQPAPGAAYADCGVELRLRRRRSATQGEAPREQEESLPA